MKECVPPWRSGTWQSDPSMRDHKKAFYSRNRINKWDEVFTIVLWERGTILWLALHETDLITVTEDVDKCFVKEKFYSRIFRWKIIFFPVWPEGLITRKLKQCIVWTPVNCCLMKEMMGWERWKCEPGSSFCYKIASCCKVRTFKEDTVWPREITQNK